MLCLKEKNSGIVIGKYENIGDAHQIYSDAKRYFDEHNQDEKELVLVENQKTIMVINSGRLSHR